MYHDFATVTTLPDGVPACSSNDGSLQFPIGPPVRPGKEWSGQHIQAPGAAPGGGRCNPRELFHGGLAPVTESQRQLFLWLNYVQRPPLFDDEILMMPADEVMRLYYSLNVATACGGGGIGGGGNNKHNPVISAGLPYLYQFDYERALQERIFNLRGDLELVRHPIDGKYYRVLLPPDMLLAPACDDKWAIIGAFLTFISVGVGGLALPVGVALSAATTAAIQTAISVGSTAVSALQARDVINEINKTTGLTREILTGLAVVQVTEAIQGPIYDQSSIDNLRAAYAFWQNLLNTLPIDLLKMRDQMPWPERLLTTGFEQDREEGKLVTTQCKLSGVEAGLKPWQGYSRECVDAVRHENLPNWILSWTPYTKFFYSDRVAQIVNSQQ